MAGDKRTTFDLGAWLCWEDEAGQNLRPPKATTWAPRGKTPVVAVTGKGYGRVCLAGLVCAKPGQRTRLMYRMLIRRGRPGEARGFSPWRFTALLDAAHRQLGGPIVLVWDNDRRHLSRVMRAMIEARPWLTVFQLPSYAPELNPAEGVWSALKRALANLALETSTNSPRWSPPNSNGCSTGPGCWTASSLRPASSSNRRNLSPSTSVALAQGTGRMVP